MFECQRCGSDLGDEEGICQICGYVYGRETAFAMPQITASQIAAAQAAQAPQAPPVEAPRAAPPPAAFPGPSAQPPFVPGGATSGAPAYAPQSHPSRLAGVPGGEKQAGGGIAGLPLFVVVLVFAAALGCGLLIGLLVFL